MNLHRLLFLTVLLWVGLKNFSFAQQNADSIQLHKISANITADFNKTIGIQSGLYNGPSYEPPADNGYNNGNAYFKDTTQLFSGSVVYDGISYINVPLLYDIYQDLLVSRIQNGAFLYSFISEKVSEFNLVGHHFIKIGPASATKLIVAGFYDELYYGKLQLLARRTKTTVKGTRGYGILQITYYSKTTYYLKKNGLYTEVDSKGAFFDVLKDKKKELKKYLIDNNISYGDNPEQTMATLANYYDKIVN